jgi:hypothetical protein
VLWWITGLIAFSVHHVTTHTHARHTHALEQLTFLTPPQHSQGVPERAGAQHSSCKQFESTTYARTTPAYVQKADQPVVNSKAPAMKRQQGEMSSASAMARCTPACMCEEPLLAGLAGSNSAAAAIPHLLHSCALPVLAKSCW